MKIERILVPVDFSESSSVAVGHAIEFAKAFDSKIDLLHSYQIQPSAVVPYQVAFPAGIFEELREAAKEQLGKVSDRVTAAGVECHMHLSQNLPSSAIVDAADELSADLIVMGTRGLTGLKHIALGSVAERTVRTAPCPVLTVGHVED
jgi:nucleotide-binding universal stress UspA family protein